MTKKDYTLSISRSREISVNKISHSVFFPQTSQFQGFKIGISCLQHWRINLIFYQQHQKIPASCQSRCKSCWEYPRYHSWSTSTLHQGPKDHSCSAQFHQVSDRTSRGWGMWCPPLLEDESVSLVDPSAYGGSYALRAFQKCSIWEHIL